MGRLVQQPPTSRADRQHPTGRGRSRSTIASLEEPAQSPPDSNKTASGIPGAVHRSDFLLLLFVPRNLRICVVMTFHLPIKVPAKFLYLSLSEVAGLPNSQELLSGLATHNC